MIDGPKSGFRFFLGGIVLPIRRFVNGGIAGEYVGLDSLCPKQFCAQPLGDVGVFASPADDQIVKIELVGSEILRQRIRQQRFPARDQEVQGKLSIHHIDALQWFMGPVQSVFAYTATLAHKMEAEDAGVAVLRFAGGALATIEGSTLTWPQNLEGSIALFGRRGSVKIGGTALNRITLWKVDGELEQEAEILTSQRVDPPSVYGYSHREVIRDFVQSLQEGRSPGTPGEEARRSLELVTAIYESARLHKEITLPL